MTALNKELSPLLSTIHESLTFDAISPSEAAESFSSKLTSFLLSQPEFQSVLFAHLHKSHSTSTEKNQKRKNALLYQAFSTTHGSLSLRSDFYHTLQLDSNLKKEHKQNTKHKSAACQGKRYNHLWWSFCRNAALISSINLTQSLNPHLPFTKTPLISSMLLNILLLQPLTQHNSH